VNPPLSRGFTHHQSRNFGLSNTAAIAANALVFTLPTGQRPSATEGFTCQGNPPGAASGFIQVQIVPAGGAYISSALAAGSILQLGTINFSTL